METKCGVCGSVFEKRRGNQRYCSEGCAREARNARRRELRRANPEKANAYLREWRRANPEKVNGYQSKWRQGHRETLNVWRRGYYWRNRDALNARRREQRRRSREERAASRDVMETVALADAKPAGCPYPEPCLECPNEGGCLFE